MRDPVGQPGCTAEPTSTAEAVAAVTTGLRFLAQADAVALGSAGQAECLKALQTAEAMHTAARVNVLAAFDAGLGYQADGCGSERSWLVWQTRVTKAAAAGSVAWVRRLRGHRPIWEALAAGALSPSWARQICEWTDRLPANSREDADAILLAAAEGGADLSDLSALAFEMYQRSCPADTDSDHFEDRSLYLGRTFGQAGRLEADMTPAASAALRAVLDSLGAKAGPEDTRTKPQREHDALEEACLRLIQSGMLPQRAGQPVHLQLQITLGQLLGMNAGSQAEAAWRAQAGGSGLTSAEAQALACDATIFPTVIGRVNNQALDELVQLFLAASGHAIAPARPAAPTSPRSQPGPGDSQVRSAPTEDSPAYTDPRGDITQTVSTGDGVSTDLTDADPNSSYPGPSRCAYPRSDTAQTRGTSGGAGADPANPDPNSSYPGPSCCVHPPSDTTQTVNPGDGVSTDPADVNTNGSYPGPSRCAYPRSDTAQSRGTSGEAGADPANPDSNVHPECPGCVALRGDADRTVGTGGGAGSGLAGHADQMEFPKPTALPDPTDPSDLPAPTIGTQFPSLAAPAGLAGVRVAPPGSGGLGAAAAGWSRERVVRRALLVKAIEVLSGPDGVAAVLRRGAYPYATVSLPLDVGEASEIIPAHLRRAIIMRDQHCRFPGCFQAPAACQVHHLRHREDGGTTSLGNCALVCRFHHLIVIHRWQWRLALHPDGTTTAVSPDGRVLRSHSPPGQAARSA